MEGLPEALELRGEEWLPADSSTDEAKTVLELFTKSRMTPDATRMMELARLAGMLVTCPGCGGKVLYELRAEIDPNTGDERQSTKPCIICDYSETVTIIPKRAVALRGRIEKLKAGGVTHLNVDRYNSLLKQYRRVMAHADKGQADGSHGNGPE